MSHEYRKVSSFKSVDQLCQRLQELGCSLPVDNQVLSKDQGSPLGQSIAFGNKVLGNRWCIHPMEGWDANPDGTPSDRTMRRWSRFGESGAKLIWGGEAAAVQPDGRANPNQLLAVAGHESQLANLRNELIRSHQAAMSTSDDLIIGLQLTHSGRFARPHGKKLEPRIAYHHPLLDERFGIDPADDSVVWTDGELDALIERFVDAARVAEKAGFDFVDVKACHGYLLHEFLGAYHRPGRYGGDLNGRSRLLISTIEAVRQACPNLMIGVRLSAIDLPPYAMGSECGEPVRFDRCMPYEYGFGMNPSDPMTFDLTEPIELIKRLKAIGVVAVNVTFGSPYYTPHIQRPAIFPPSDGYLPPEDPLVGVHRHIETVARFKREVPDMILVGSGYTYLQDYLPHVAQAAVRQGMVDVVGLGRMVLSYPWLPADTLAGRPMARKFVCRTFSDCTSAPRNGMPSGCYPLDPFYKATPEAEVVRKLRSS